MSDLHFTSHDLVINRDFYFKIFNNGSSIERNPRLILKVKVKNLDQSKLDFPIKWPLSSAIELGPEINLRICVGILGLLFYTTNGYVCSTVFVINLLK